MCNKHFFVSRHYRKHTVIYSEVNANVLNRFVSIVDLFHFSPVSSAILCFVATDRFGCADVGGMEASK
jgi:hypothetical protein